MNYIAQINAFYVWLETNDLEHPARNLWHALMHIANRTGWKETFNVAIGTLVVKTGMNKQAIQRARNTLAQTGRIVWRSRGGGQSAEYRIVPFPVQKQGLFGPQATPPCDPSSDSSGDPESQPIPKPEQTKPNQASPEGDGARTRVRPFAPPTEQEVGAYCRERGNAVDAERFVDYYTARGWMVGKNRMRDWKAAVRTWEKNTGQRFAASGTAKDVASGNIFADMAREMRCEEGP